MIFRIILLVFLPIGMIQAQNLRVAEFGIKNYDADSLATIIEKSSGIEKIDALNYLSNVLFLKYTDSSAKLATHAIELSKKINYKKGIADGYYYLGNTFYIRDSLGPTLRNYLKALRIYEDLDPSEGHASVVGLLAMVNGMYNRFEQALLYAKQALALWTALNNKAGIRNATMGIATDFYFLRNSDSTISYSDSSFIYFYKALDLLEKYPNNYQLPHVLNDLGRLNGYMFDKTNDTAYIDTAITWFKKGLAIPDLEYEWTHMLTYNLADFYQVYSSPDSVAIGNAYFKKFYSMADTNVWILRRNAWELYDMGKFDEALKLFERARVKNKKAIEDFLNVNSGNPIYSIGKKKGFYTYKAYIYEGLFSCYEALGNAELAFENYKKFKETELILKEKETEDLFNLLEAESKEEKRRNQIIIMGQENELKDAKLKQARMANWGLIAIVFVIGLVGFMFIHQNKMKNEHKTVLLEQKLLRLQMNPHFIFNALSNILNLVDQKDNKKAANYLATFSKLLRTTLESTREDMVPFEKEVGSLKNYLELQKLRYQNKFDYSIEVDDEIDEEDMAIPPMLVQPFIENAIEHGIRHKQTPGRIDVRFLLKGNKIQCEVEDDGVGRSKAWEAEARERAGHKSLATEIIKDRIKNLNKKFKQKIQLEIIDIISEGKEASGTKVLLDLPYHTVYE